jgi:hypothetical protein
MAVERKYERDIDLLLAEELSVNRTFADWVKSKTKFAATAAEVIDVFVSKADNLGESDLIAIYADELGRRFALMIEDKIDAPLQPQQAERYRLRAAREIQLEAYTECAIILCAPQYYISNSIRSQEFDCTLSFEDIGAFLRGGEAARRDLYRAAFLESAATRRVNNWMRAVDASTEAFWEAAYIMATRDFPVLEMKRLKVTKDSTWINFRPADMPTMPKRIYVSVKGDRGQMDLTFSSTQAHRFHEQIAGILDTDMTIHQTSASAAIRIEVPGFAPSENLDDSLPKVRHAFTACERLITFYRTHRAILDLAAHASPGTSRRR